MKSRLRIAFENSCQGYSPDRVVADPELNAAFLDECRALGIAGSSSTLNRAVLNLRKRGGLRGLKSRRSSFPNLDEYLFAAEIAARFIERRDGVTLDDIICDPQLAAGFDQLAAQISPGYRPVEYRWAALNLRKSRRLAPEILSRVVQPVSIEVVAVAGLDVGQLPTGQGLYVLLTNQRVLYVGEAENLQNRLRKHLDHSDNKGLARWIWEAGSETLFAELQVLPEDTATRVRKALEAELIRSRNPEFNVKRP